MIRSVAQIQAGPDVSLEGLFSHPGRPWVATLDADRPVIRVWDCSSDQIRLVAVIDEQAAPYPSERWLLYGLTPELAWHPDAVQLLICTPGRLRLWSPQGLQDVANLPATIGYRDVAFSPDGSTVWACPAADDDQYERCDVIALDQGIVGSAPYWDTGIVEHPAGGLLLTLVSDQGESYGIFAETGGQRLRAALILDADGYRKPVFSPDGRFLAIRGNAYQDLLSLYAFPTLEEIVRLPLDALLPEGHPEGNWSGNEIAFDRYGTLWIGTPVGEIVLLDLEHDNAEKFPVPGGFPVLGVALLATGQLLVTGERDLVLVEPTEPTAEAAEADPALVQAFIAGTEALPEGSALPDSLTLHDGRRSWDGSELAVVTSAEDTDPMWLRARAGINQALQQEPPR
ncbi:WD40 repeat domain-containing protein [Kineosporia babensis]|uniref:Uncharacterized protein n=1 Tax=Kineosporia babensis TaxID=499548 RepID=A0A9X1STN7_9ACTN|nr:hypothetical protein [Kineosporia babensis]MCD5310750.1 hypothetical protein [Kineosporia babensis]